MSVDLYTPSFRSVRGNTTVSQRLICSLGHRAKVHVISPELPGAHQTPSSEGAIHGLNITFLESQRPRFAGRPFAVSVTGTDLYEDAENPERRASVMRCLREASVALTLHGGVIPKLKALAPDLPVVVIPPASDLREPGKPWLREALGLGPDDRLLLLPSGHRPVKAPLLAVDAILLLAERHPRVHLAILGTSIDEETTNALLQAADRCPRIHVPSPRPHADLAAAYQESDIVLNTSRSEGLPQAILEAMTVGRPVVVRDIEGNRALVEDGVNGRLFEDAIDLAVVLDALLKDPGTCARLAEAAAQSVSWRSTALEAELHLMVYEWLRHCDEKTAREGATLP